MTERLWQRFFHRGELVLQELCERYVVLAGALELELGKLQQKGFHDVFGADELIQSRGFARARPLLTLWKHALRELS